MGTFSVPVQVGESAAQRFIEIEALVDTGASDTLLPSNVLAELDIEPIDRFTYSLADDRVVEYDVGEVRVRLEGRERTVQVVFGPEGAEPLLGATTLEIFHLGVDPVEQRLIPVRGLLK